jgi:NAD(P)-dependent dehydrogenase (short-subunit alcohol dehydrogenase family)
MKTGQSSLDEFPAGLIVRATDRGMPQALRGCIVVLRDQASATDSVLQLTASGLVPSANSSRDAPGLLLVGDEEDLKRLIEGDLLLATALAQGSVRPLPGTDIDSIHCLLRYLADSAARSRPGVPTDVAAQPAAQCLAGRSFFAWDDTGVLNLVDEISSDLASYGARVTVAQPSSCRTDRDARKVASRTNRVSALSPRAALQCLEGVCKQGEAVTDILFGSALSNSPGALIDFGHDELMTLLASTTLNFVELVHGSITYLRQAGRDAMPTITALTADCTSNVVAGQGPIGVVYAAVEAAVRQLSHELGADGIRVNAVALPLARTTPSDLHGSALNQVVARRSTAESAGQTIASLVRSGRMITGETIRLGSEFLGQSRGPNALDPGNQARGDNDRHDT